MEQSINLLIVISNLGHGGAERQVVELCNRLNKAVFNVHLCTLSEHTPLAASLSPDVTQHVIQKRGKFDPSVIWRLAALMRREQITLAHSFLLDAEIATRLAGQLVPATIVIGSERNSKHTYSRTMSLALQLTRHVPDAVIANSNAGRQYHQNTFKLDPAKYHVVYNGVDTDRFKPGDSKLSHENLGLSPADFIIGMVGSFKPQKNHKYLLDVIERLVKVRQDFHVLLVGATVHEGDSVSEAYYDDIIEKLQQRNLASYFTMIGARLDIDQIYRLCDITVLPSLFEGTPNVALESLACGVPVIATNVSDNALVIPNEKVGYIVELDQPEQFMTRILTLIESTEKREALSRQAAEWIQQEFSTTKMADNMSQVYLAQLKQQESAQ